MKASLAICILTALLAVGACLQCEVCFALGHSCMGALETCGAREDSCGIVRTETTLVGLKTQSFLKGCVTSSYCKAGPISVNLGKGLTIRTSVACCVGEACRAINVTVPPTDTKPNGRHCPACVALFTDQCTEESVDCTGDETHCVVIAESITFGGNPAQIVMKGCASESVCAQLKVGSSTFAGIRANLTTAECRAASGTAGGAPGAACC
ncbi:phospholipase A2 inhibitor and Ly6/PLAUR domain-containing protein-like [Emydura macquarii macquarii]|uniref:phospholipase A2 inhibitor and Ly6/PLAUR domain-containing protein-like n=1 Tax=Emydura macquarii macquarii TaxID=1129001 RepID=UPI00352A404D